MIGPAEGTNRKCIFQHFKAPGAVCQRYVVSYDLAYETAMGYGSADLWMDALGAAEPEAELDVLFIGTDPVIAEVYRRKLELDGYRLTVVRSHAQARESVPRL